MKTAKSGIVELRKEKHKKRPACAQQKLEKDEAKKEPWERREEETQKLLTAAKRKLPELKALLVAASDHWHYEDPIYRFYHASFKVGRVQTTTVKIVEELQALAPHLKLNELFLKIVAEGTGKQFHISHKASSLKRPRAMIEAFFHARHMLLMVCKYAEELPEPPPVLPSGWATVLYLYNVR